jgi:hypothetical protein
LSREKPTPGHDPLKARRYAPDPRRGDSLAHDLNPLRPLETPLETHRAEAIEVGTGGHAPSRVVESVPGHDVRAALLLVADQCAHSMTLEVVDVDLDPTAVVATQGTQNRLTEPSVVETIRRSMSGALGPLISRLGSYTVPGSPTGAVGPGVPSSETCWRYPSLLPR